MLTKNEQRILLHMYKLQVQYSKGYIPNCAGVELSSGTRWFLMDDMFKIKMLSRGKEKGLSRVKMYKSISNLEKHGMVKSHKRRGNMRRAVKHVNEMLGVVMSNRQVSKEAKRVRQSLLNSESKLSKQLKEGGTNIEFERRLTLSPNMKILSLTDAGLVLGASLLLAESNENT
jgi:hypothetical protein